MTALILKRAPNRDNQDDYDGLENGVVVDRIFKVPTARRKVGPGCGRVATTARYGARGSAMRRREYDWGRK
jgi:hypothetical protein